MATNVGDERCQLNGEVDILRVANGTEDANACQLGNDTLGLAGII